MSGANDLIQSILSGMAYLESKKRYLDTENNTVQ